MPTSSICIMRPNYPGAEFVGKAFLKVQADKGKFTFICVHVLQKTLNLVISRRCFAEKGKEMYQNVQRTCRAIVMLIKLSLLFCDVLVGVAVVSCVRSLLT